VVGFGVRKENGTGEEEYDSLKFMYLCNYASRLGDCYQK
jgi:hypothetical protein